MPDSDGLVPLYHALFSAENHEVAQLLIEAGADVNVTIENGFVFGCPFQNITLEPLLHLLVEKPESVAFLLKHKPDLKTSDSKVGTLVLFVNLVVIGASHPPSRYSLDLR